MRLIDADKLIKRIKENNDLPWNLPKVDQVAFISCLEHTDTAYNVEKVVEQLEEQKEVYSPVAQEGYFKGKVAGLCDAIDIVKRGGVNDD